MEVSKGKFFVGPGLLNDRTFRCRLV